MTDINIIIYPEPAGAPAAYRIVTTAATQTAPVSNPRLETLEGTLRKHEEAIRSLESLASELFERVGVPAAVTSDIPAGGKKTTPPAKAWTPEEEAVVRNCRSVYEAKEQYEKAYPGRRSPNAVKHKYEKVCVTENSVPAPAPTALLMPVTATLEPGIAPVREVESKPDIISPSAEEVPKAKNRKGKYDFQISFPTSDPRYQTTWGRCKKYGKSYPELVAAGLDLDSKPPRKSPRKDPITVAEMKQSIQAIDSSNEVTAREKIRDLTDKSNGKIVVGQTVKHNGAKSNPHFGQKGEVKKTYTDGRLMVLFGNDLETVHKSNVVVVPEVGA
jgi:hypothetical protein